MNKRNLRLILIIGSILLCCFFSTVAYSAIYTTMSINGVAYARPVKDVRITDFKLNSSSTNSTSSYEEFSVNTISTQFNLVDSSSSIVFDVEVTNYGSADVGILNLIGTMPTDLSYEIINYNLKDKICDDTGKCNQMSVKTFQIKFTGTPGEYEINFELDFRTYHKVTYTDITNNNYPTEVIDGGNLNITFTENLKKVTILSDGAEVDYYDSISSGQTITVNSVSSEIEIKRKKELVARLVSGEIDEVGSEVCIKDECFYIISNDGSTVAMLAKYNLHVGYKFDDVNSEVLLENPTGIQSENAVGWFDEYSEDNPIIGTNVFARGNYWKDSEVFPVYIYDSNVAFFDDVSNYGKYLYDLGVRYNAIRLIKFDELETLGCDIDSNSCVNAPAFVTSTTYWTGTAVTSESIYTVSTNKYFNQRAGYYNYNYGVRPVIEMSVDDIKLPTKPVIVSGDYNTVGSEVAIDDEHFYVISSTADTVTMLAKYNLHVGNSVDEDNNLTPLASPTGIQDKDSLGCMVDVENAVVKYPFIGTVAFSSEYYWEDVDIYASTSNTAYVYNANATIYTYVNNYKLYLETLGLVVDEARLIKYDELLGLGCFDWNCKNAPNWIYSTTYWTGDACDDMGYVLAIYRHSLELHMIDFSYYNADVAGVRPVITISKEYF